MRCKEDAKTPMGQEEERQKRIKKKKRWGGKRTGNKYRYRQQVCCKFLLCVGERVWVYVGVGCVWYVQGLGGGEVDGATRS